TLRAVLSLSVRVVSAKSWGRLQAPPRQWAHGHPFLAGLCATTRAVSLPQGCAGKARARPGGARTNPSLPGHDPGVEASGFGRIAEEPGSSRQEPASG